MQNGLLTHTAEDGREKEWEEIKKWAMQWRLKVRLRLTLHDYSFAVQYDVLRTA